MATLVYEISVQFSWDFYETVLVGKFQSREIGEKCASRHSLIITQLYPISRNFTGSPCNIIAKLNAATHGRCRPVHPHDGLHEVVWSLPHAVRQSGTVWYGTSALSASQTPCHASSGSSWFLADVIFTQTTHTTPHRGTRRVMHSEYSSSNLHVVAACKGSNGDASLASGRHHYRVNTWGNRRCDDCANDCLVCSPYYPQHDEQAARIKGRCVKL